MAAGADRRSSSPRWVLLYLQRLWFHRCIRSFLRAPAQQINMRVRHSLNIDDRVFVGQLVDHGLPADAVRDMFNQIVRAGRPARPGQADQHWSKLFRSRGNPRLAFRSGSPAAQSAPAFISKVKGWLQPICPGARIRLKAAKAFRGTGAGGPGPRPVDVCLADRVAGRMRQHARGAGKRRRPGPGCPGRAQPALLAPPRTTTTANPAPPLGAQPRSPTATPVAACSRPSSGRSRP